jgi:hypothetical protein
MDMKYLAIATEHALLLINDEVKTTVMKFETIPDRTCKIRLQENIEKLLF